MAGERTISSSATVGASQQEVWEFLCDTQRYADWVDGTLEVVRTDGPAQLGTTYEERSRIAGPWKAKTSWKVSEFEAPRRQVHDGEGVPTMEGLAVVLELTPSGETGTELTISYRYTPKFGALGALMDSAARGTVARAQRRSVDAVAAIFAREAPAVATPSQESQPGS